MPRNIASLINDHEISNIEGLDGILHLATTVLTYSVDEKDVSAIETKVADTEIKDISLLTETELLKNILDNNFFDKIYVQTLDIETIRSTFPMNKFVLYYGPTGSGKTTNILKLVSEFKFDDPYCYSYYDIRGSSAFFQSHHDDSEINIETNVKIFKKIINEHVYNDFIRKKNLGQSFSIYRLIRDPQLGYVFDPLYARYSDILVKDKSSFDFDKVDSLRELYNNLWNMLQTKEYFDLFLSLLETINSETNKYNYQKDILLVLNFVKEIIGKKPILFIDNVDAQPYNIQRVILISGIELSDNPYNITVIGSLRNTNLERLEKWGADGAIRINLQQKLSKPILPEQIKEVNKLNIENIANMINKRMEILFENENKLTHFQQGIDNILSYFVKDSKDKESKLLYYKTYKDELNAYLRKLRATYINEDVIKYCNYSLRAMLVEYNGFINTHIYNLFFHEFILPEIFNEKGEVIEKRIRNCFYRWIILNLRSFVNPLIETKLKCHNFFDDVENYELAKSKSGIVFLKLKILEDLSKRKTGVKYGFLKKSFKTFHIDDSLLKDALQKLERGSGNRKLFGLLRIDTSINEEEISDQSIIEITDAGLFYIDKLSTSLEYLLWMALYTNIDRKIKMVRKYSDLSIEKNKLNIVEQFLSYLKDKFTEEYDMVNDSRYKEHYKLRNGYYLERVFKSIFKYRDKYWNFYDADEKGIWKNIANLNEQHNKLLDKNKYM